MTAQSVATLFNGHAAAAAVVCTGVQSPVCPSPRPSPRLPETQTPRRPLLSHGCPGPFAGSHR